MKRVQFYPGATGLGNNITIPAAAPDIDAVLVAEITRMSLAQGNAVHTDANVALAFADHAPGVVAACLQDHPTVDIANAFADHTGANVALGVVAHTQANVIACMIDHPVHAHDLGVIVGAVLAGEEYGAAGAGGTGMQATGGPQTILGGDPLTGGVLNNAAAQAHVVSGTDLAHGAGADVVHGAGANVPHVGVADLAHGAGNPLVHGAAADPVVAVPALTKFSTRIVRFTAVNILDGDLVTLVYQEVGEVVHAS